MANSDYKLVDYPAIHDMNWSARPRVLPPDGPARECCGREMVQHYHDGRWFEECFRCGKEVES